MKSLLSLEIPAWLLQTRRLSTGAKLLFALASRLADRDGRVDASLMTLAALLGVCKDSVAKLIRELIRCRIADRDGPRINGRLRLRFSLDTAATAVQCSRNDDPSHTNRRGTLGTAPCYVTTKEAADLLGLDVGQIETAIVRGLPAIKLSDAAGMTFLDLGEALEWFRARQYTVPAWNMAEFKLAALVRTTTDQLSQRQVAVAFGRPQTWVRQTCKRLGLCPALGWKCRAQAKRNT